MSRRPEVRVAVLGGSAVLVYLSLPGGGLAQSLLILGVLLAAQASLVRGVLRLPHDERGPWKVLIGAQVVYGAVSVAWFVGPVAFGLTLPYPSVVDFTYFAAYLLMAGFFLALLRPRGSKGEGAISGVSLEAAAVAVMGAFLADELIVRPLLGGDALTTAAGVTSILYPVFVVVLLALSLQAIARGRLGGANVALFSAWILGELASDVWYARASLDGTFRYGHPMFAGWLISYAALGAMGATLGQRSTSVGSVPTPSPRRQLVVLAGVSVAVVVTEGQVEHRGSVVGDFVGSAWLLAGLALVFLRMRGLLRDVELERALRTDVERLATELEVAATHDPLTGLVNRHVFEEALGRALVARYSPGHAAAMMVLDLDAFKAVNDTYGHPVGDDLLRDVASRLGSVTRPGDVVARLGGDEFAIVLEQTEVRTAVEVARRVIAVLAGPTAISGREIAVGVSVGVHVAVPGESLGDVVSNADAALYAAKRAGGGWELFDPVRHRVFVERYQLELDLRAAPVRGGLVLHYQPILDLASREAVGVEALLRWNHPERGFLSPLEFMSVAEESGAIVEVGRWVLRQACADARSWQQGVPGASHVGVAVNLSRRQLGAPSIVDEVSDVLAVTGLAPRALTLEVTETALANDDGEMVALLDKFSALGVQVAMDDFGTGYSSLAQLRTMPVDVLKIDKAFVDGIAREEEEWALAAAIVRLATSLDKRTLAEGIERASQLAHLRSLGCELGQGYLFARPMPLADLEVFLAERSGAS